MPKPCSQDLRVRLIEAVESGAARCEAAKSLEVSASSSDGHALDPAVQSAVLRSVRSMASGWFARPEFSPLGPNCATPNMACEV